MNRRARHDYEVLDTLECGIVLRGSEVKSIRDGQVQLADAYARVDGGELWLFKVHIAPYAMADGLTRIEPERPRKLLAHRGEIEKLRSRIERDRLTLVPLRLYFHEGKVKVELAVARGRKREDKRHALAEKDARREAQRSLVRRTRG
jgi:SsrA-binding protein